MIKTAIENKIVNLYHYQKFNEEYIADLLLNDRIKFSNPSSFNDPWDCKLNFSKVLLDDPVIYKSNVEYAIDIQRRHLGVPETELLAQAEQLSNNRPLMEARIDEFTRAMNDAINKDYRVYCLSTEPSNLLMWAHYTESHKGVCFGFKSESTLLSNALEVVYADNYPKIDPSEEDDEKFFREVILTKSKAWQYENEYRLIGKDNVSEDFFTLEDSYLSFDAGDLVSIIIGCSISEENILILKKILSSRKSHVELFQVFPANDKYAFVIRGL